LDQIYLHTLTLAPIIIKTENGIAKVDKNKSKNLKKKERM